MSVLGPSPPRIPIGYSDYRELRQQGFTYVDKTRFIGNILDSGAVATLLPRPRRFGKTLNLSTLRYFLEESDEDLTDVFADTWVWDADGGRYRAHFQRYPVVYLTFKDVKAETWEEAKEAIVDLLMRETQRFNARYPAKEEHQDVHWWTGVGAGDAALSAFVPMLSYLSRRGRDATGERTVVLVDEYDAPLHAAWRHGYWDSAVAFFRGFLSAGLKDNPDLYRGVLTGILRVAKEGIFSGLNNVAVRSLMNARQATDFGFTEAEVEALAEACGQASALDGLRRWYNGYRFGGSEPHVLYNPWSILRFLADPADGLQAYWKNSSSNALVRDLLIRFAGEVGADLSHLVAGGTVERIIDDNVALPEVHRSADTLWGMLTFSGYLSPDTAKPDLGRYRASLRIPNAEVRSVYEEIFLSALSDAAGYAGLDRMKVALLSGDAAQLEADLGEALRALSFHDFTRKPIEAVYQAFVIGLLVHLRETHRVTSNREAGYGRADVLVIPRSPGPGTVFELKVVGERETAETAMRRAAEQLLDRDYAAEVIAAGATEAHLFAIVFDGKRCHVESVQSTH